MSSLTLSPSCSSDAEIWENLKGAIASSSGFERWRSERSADAEIQSLSKEQQVRIYLRETLETLAY
ncbi:MAG: hypothetical protein GDA48_24225 [Hormoscilla sp. GM102CHS1]|nr:hypothetical protein [Hormoscilla sp. SP12CHS1]MBC6475524.1 hypothetical protein [Hormoscilla sp. GM102CHS1]